MIEVSQFYCGSIEENVVPHIQTHIHPMERSF